MGEIIWNTQIVNVNVNAFVFVCTSKMSWPRPKSLQKKERKKETVPYVQRDMRT